MSVTLVVAACAAIGLLVNVGMIGFAWGSLKANQDNMMLRMTALHETIVNLRRALGLQNGDEGMFVRRTEAKAQREAIEARISAVESKQGG